MTRTRIAVLASGRGTNLQAILDHFARLGERRRGDVVLVASDHADAGALARARAVGIDAKKIDKHCTDLAALLQGYSVELVVLAGFLRHVPDAVVHRYAGRLINVHPALLPAFGGPGMYGGHVHDAVLAAGVKVTGVTAHFVDEVYDRGTIIAQWPVPVLAGDDRATLATRVLRVEHILYPRVVNAVAGGKITLAACQHRERPSTADAVEFTMLSREDDCLAEDIDRALGC